MPGKAPKTASEFSCWEAICALRKTMSWERKAARERGEDDELVGSDSEERCHCEGERSRTTDKWEDMTVEIQAEHRTN